VGLPRLRSAVLRLAHHDLPALPDEDRGRARAGRHLRRPLHLDQLVRAADELEFTEFVHEGLTVSTSPFGSSFYLLTSFHGAHVAIGVLMLLATALMSWAGKLRPGEGMNVEAVGLYWHFVDIVWIVIFTVVYLLQV
jgi:hypothetical protein